MHERARRRRDRRQVVGVQAVPGGQCQLAQVRRQDARAAIGVQVPSLRVDDDAAPRRATRGDQACEGRIGQHALRIVTQDDDVRSPATFAAHAAGGPRSRSSQARESSQSSRISCCPRPRTRSLRVVRRSGSWTTARTSMPAAVHSACSCRPASSLPMTPARVDVRPEHRYLSRDVGCASQPVLQVAGPDYRHRRLRRDPLDRAVHVLVEHQVADDPDLPTAAGFENSDAGLRSRQAQKDRSFAVARPRVILESGVCSHPDDSPSTRRFASRCRVTVRRSSYTATSPSGSRAAALRPLPVSTRAVSTPAAPRLSGSGRASRGSARRSRARRPRAR